MEAVIDEMGTNAPSVYQLFLQLDTDTERNAVNICRAEQGNHIFMHTTECTVVESERSAAPLELYLLQVNR